MGSQGSGYLHQLCEQKLRISLALGVGAQARHTTTAENVVQQEVETMAAWQEEALYRALLAWFKEVIEIRSYLLLA